jgi:hypothetical protein
MHGSKYFDLPYFSLNFKQSNNGEYISGDSGGGMVLEVEGLSKIIGIVSAAIAKIIIVNRRQIQKICDLENYLIYTDVSKFTKWINQVIFESTTFY